MCGFEIGYASGQTDSRHTYTLNAIYFICVPGAKYNNMRQLKCSVTEASKNTADAMCPLVHAYVFYNLKVVQLVPL